MATPSRRLRRFEICRAGEPDSAVHDRSLVEVAGRDILPFGGTRIDLCAVSERSRRPDMKPLAAAARLQRVELLSAGRRGAARVSRRIQRDELTPAALRSIGRTLHNALEQAYFAFMRQRKTLAPGTLSCAGPPLGRETCWKSTGNWPTSTARSICCCRRRRSTPKAPGASFAARGSKSRPCFSTGRWRSIPRCSSGSCI